MSFVSKILTQLGIQQKYEIYTDGSAKEGRGAWAFVIVKNHKVFFEASGRAFKTSCNRMEFQAAIEALEWIGETANVQIYSDSRTLVDALNLKNKRSLYGSDQLKQLDKLNNKHRITWRWIRAHSGNLFNERCDQLCRVARGQP